MGEILCPELNDCDRWLFNRNLWWRLFNRWVVQDTLDGLILEKVMWEKVRKWELKGMQFDIPHYKALAMWGHDLRWILH